MAISRVNQTRAAMFLLAATAIFEFIELSRLHDERTVAKTQLQERTPKVSVVDIDQPIVDDKGRPLVRLKYVTWKDEMDKDQRFACGEVINGSLVVDRDGHAIAAIWPEPRLSNAY